jgi:hypothetical protein
VEVVLHQALVVALVVVVEHQLLLQVKMPELLMVEQVVAQMLVVAPGLVVARGLQALVVVEVGVHRVVQEMLVPVVVVKQST